MAQRTNPRLLILRTLALLTGLTGGFARADPLYTVTNLGSGNITYTTASGTATASSDPTGQLVSVSNGQVTYSFATTPDTILYAGQGPLSFIPLSLNPNPALYSNPQVSSGLLNGNGLAALSVALFPNVGEPTSVAYVFPQNSDGTLAWSQGGIIPPSQVSASSGDINEIWIAGLNTANQILLGETYSVVPYNDALVYDAKTGMLTDLGYLPQISAGYYSNLAPIAIDNQGQVLVKAFSLTSSGYVQDTLLITPGGAPNPLATPEPGSCVLWAVITCASYVAAKRAKFVR